MKRHALKSHMHELSQTPHELKWKGNCLCLVDPADRSLDLCVVHHQMLGRPVSENSRCQALHSGLWVLCMAFKLSSPTCPLSIVSSSGTVTCRYRWSNTACVKWRPLPIDRSGYSFTGVTLHAWNDDRAGTGSRFHYSVSTGQGTLSRSQEGRSIGRQY